MAEAVTVVWLKRDLRTYDHLPLKMAEQHPFKTIILYCFEPSLIQAPDSDVRHWRFVWQSLADMNEVLHKSSKQLISIFNCEAIQAFEYINQQYEIKHVWAHIETGNKISYERDKKISAFFCNQGIRFEEFVQNGVQRGRINRRNWNNQWTAFMEQPTILNKISNMEVLHVDPPDKWQIHHIKKEIIQYSNQFQIGGFKSAHKILDSFIKNRVQFYSKHISKPLQSANSCSRLSAHIAYGNISIRQIYQACLLAMQHSNKKQFTFFISRLHWHCHFIQKFETDCSMEFDNLNKAFDAVRTERNEVYIEAWKNGQTGFPLIDACMCCLAHTGYINFRMRAMLVSFLTHNLWQHWNTGVHHLACYFLDYEPGIHYPQWQMQAGTMGVNTIRTYNPIKQSKDHDPDGIFIKKWLKELKDVPVQYVHEPWLMSDNDQLQYNCILGVDYPFPIIDLTATSRYASQQLWKIKKSAEAKIHNKHILDVHTARTSMDEQIFPSQKKKQVKNSDLNYKLF
jgi:deoxyribodipyrimidine photo-lyase